MENFEKSNREDSQDQKDQSLLEKFRNEDPNRRVEVSAIEALDDPDEIRKFFGEYVKDYVSSEKEHDPDAEKQAMKNISYFVRSFDAEKTKTWQDALPELFNDEEDQEKEK